jgi:hypothetical protein
MSSEAIVSNNQRSLPTWFYVRLCLKYSKFNVRTKNIVRATCVKTSSAHWRIN